MPRQVTNMTNDQRLQRVLVALERELLQASDEEVRQAAADIRIDPDMQGSIAWLGIFFPNGMKPAQVFDMEALRQNLPKELRLKKAPPAK